MAFSPTARAALIVALGGALLGFDSAVVNGVVEPVRRAFDLTPTQLGFTGSCLILGAMLGNAVAGPLANRFGRRSVLVVTAALFTVSAIWSALATGFVSLVFARIVGGLGVGGAILIAPIYIAEIAPPEQRGRLVSFNQLNIVLGISAALFSNYFIERALDESVAWRWMLAVEAVPAILYFTMLWTVPRSPRWLLTQGRDAEARAAVDFLRGPDAPMPPKDDPDAADGASAGLGALFSSPVRRVLTIALALAFFQQITGINAIFYYSATIFVKAGASMESALFQGALIGVVNLVFTLVAMRLIDRAGRRPLLLVGSAGMAAALFITSFAFDRAEYRFGPDDVAAQTEAVAAIGEDGEMTPEEVADARVAAEARLAVMTAMLGEVHGERRDFNAAAVAAYGATGPDDEALAAFERDVDGLANSALIIDGMLVLAAIMLFIASFAISLGPVMWAMLSEIFPNRLRGIGISVAGLFNSLVSFSVVQLFPASLFHLGEATTFLIFGVLASCAFLFTLRFVPETKGRSLEELEAELVGSGGWAVRSSGASRAVGGVVVVAMAAMVAFKGSHGASAAERAPGSPQAGEAREASSPKVAIAVAPSSAVATSTGAAVPDGASVVFSEPDAGWLEYTVEVPATGRYDALISVEPMGEAETTVWIEDHVGNPDGRHYDITGPIALEAGSELTVVERHGSPMAEGTHRIRFHHTGGPVALHGLELELRRPHEPTPEPLVQDMEGDAWTLVWSDEFDGDGPVDTAKWTYDVGDWGWGNREPQYYTVGRTENARRENGVLVIEARKDDLDRPWTSARLTTRGKQSFLYGKIVIRAKVPAGDGAWAAGWLLGDDYRDETSWPYCGEIDVMEAVGREIGDDDGRGLNHASCHTRAYYFKQGNHISETIEVEDMVGTFHDYAVEWTPEEVRMYVDGEHYYTYDKHGSEEAWPFDRPQNLILNLAMGGGMGGPIDPDLTSQRVEVDHVRVYGGE